VLNGGEVVEMGEGDVVNLEYESPSSVEPRKAVGPNDLPPLLIFVDCDSYRRKPHPSRGPSR
jgi:hypothetical protein